MKKILTIVIIAAVVIGGYLVVNKKQEPRPEAIKIGMIIPLTGWGGYWGEGQIKGAKLAEKEINQDSEKLRVMIEDSKTDAKDASSAAQKLVTIDKVDGLSVEFTSPTSAVSPISSRGEIPLPYNAYIKSPLQDNPFAFKMYFDIEKECGVAIKYLQNKGHKKIGALILNLDLGVECKKGINENVKNLNSSVVFYDFNVDVTDFRTIIAKMKNDGIDSVVTVAYEENASAFFKQKSEQKLNVPVYAAGGRPDNFNEKIYKGLPPEILEGTITYDQKINDKFSKNIKNIYPDITEKDLISAAYGYDEVYYLYNALSMCPEKSLKCLKGQLTGAVHTDTALEATGFDNDRVLKLRPVYYVFTHGEFVEIQI